jgi:predicted RNA-binding Zn-ribbon protein involved in translation (DUF1610 family)
MPEHYTKETVSASFWCKKCGKETLHRVDKGRRGPCYTCMAALEAEHKKPKPVPREQQGELFDGK